MIPDHFLRKLACIAAILSLSALASASAGCSGKEDTRAEPVVSSIKVDKGSVELVVGEKTTVKAGAVPDSPDLPPLEWKSADTKVATVAKGEITGTGVGETVVTVSCLNASRDIKVKVKAQKDYLVCKNEIPILAWYSIPADYTSVARYRELKEAGFHISFTHTSTLAQAQAALKAADQAGIKNILMCGELSSDPEGVVKAVKDEPALYGYFLRDEPVIADFPALAAWADRIRAVDSEHPMYLNLNPTYAGEAHLGGTYEEYVREFIRQVRLPMVSFDHYPVMSGGIRSDFWQNLEIISKVSAEAGLPFWAFTLSTSHDPYPIPTMASLRFQLYTDLAYGAQVLQYFTYWNPPQIGWNFHDAPINLNGNKTEVYNLVQLMNQELQKRADVWVGGKVLSVVQAGKSGSVPKGTTPMTKLPEGVSMLDTGNNGAVVSLIENGSHRYLMLVNHSISSVFTYKIKFSVSGVKRIESDGELVSLEDDKLHSYVLGKGDCAIFRLK